MFNFNASTKKNTVMKLLKNIFLLAVGTMVLPLACSDLEEDPIAILAPESVFRTPTDVETAVNGIYGRLASEDSWGRKLSLTIMLRSDMLDIGDRGTPSRRQQVNDFEMDSNNGMVTAFWPSTYQAISAANAAIAGGEAVAEPAEEINPLIAEARFMRAYCYFHLVQLFGDVPYLDAVVDDIAALENTGKTPAADVWQNIIADLEYAKVELPDVPENGVRSRPSKGSAAAYLASVYLTLGDYQNAYNEAKYVIDNSGTFGYALEGDFQHLFDANRADGLVEPIFTFDFLGLVGQYPINVDYLTALTGMRGRDQVEGWSVAVPSFAVYEDWDNRDYRKWVSFDTAAVIGDTLRSYESFGNPDARRPHCAKYFRYPGNAGGNNVDSDHNYIQMRYAEVLLIAAEALSEISGPNAEAIGYVNQVRARARMADGEASDFPEDVAPGQGQAEFLDTVLEERRLELAFEAKRWYDIRRRQLGEAVFAGPDSFEPHPNFTPSRDYLLPLPADELTRNESLAPQNPGY